MRNISRTLQDPQTGIHMWERFTTKGIPKNAHKYVSYFSHYLLNMLPRSLPDVYDQYKYYLRNTDMVRVRGIGVHLDIFLAPHSGYRLRLLTFQTPYDMTQLTDNRLNDNSPTHPDGKIVQGCYKSNGKLMSNLQANEDGRYIVTMNDGLSNLFGDQKVISDSTD